MFKQLTPPPKKKVRERESLEKLIVAQLVMKLLTLHITQMFHIRFTIAHQRTLP
jgi:hypothetical protein